MKTLSEKKCLFKIVETKTWAKLILQDLWDVKYLEQNPLKDSKYGIAYRKLKQVYPDLYMFWELKNNEFTGKLKLEIITDKKGIDSLIDSILSDEDYKNYEDVNPEV